MEELRFNEPDQDRILDNSKSLRFEDTLKHPISILVLLGLLFLLIYLIYKLSSTKDSEVSSPLQGQSSSVSNSTDSAGISVQELEPGMYLLHGPNAQKAVQSVNIQSYGLVSDPQRFTTSNNFTTAELQQSLIDTSPCQRPPPYYGVSPSAPYQ
ncbi:DgyrCDS1024 [Dimorphilus gyrociliatus]|uniref:DgyrCDS1024 n=1 Tax=Dimorphilus gyrociliatus TaxID=2664684 RepID=A0A7I8V7H9_9ANNE|nr:DgyrCDS1024 [Dimorphilus gyrociliatus]